MCQLNLDEIRILFNSKTTITKQTGLSYVVFRTAIMCKCIIVFLLLKKCLTVITTGPPCYKLGLKPNILEMASKYFSELGRGSHYNCHNRLVHAWRNTLQFTLKLPELNLEFTQVLKIHSLYLKLLLVLKFIY